MKITLFVKSTFIVIAIGLSQVFFFAFAQDVYVRGMGSDSKKEVALKKALLSAWKNYASTLKDSKLLNVMDNEKMFTDDLENVITNVQVIDEKCESGWSGMCSVSIKATVSDSIINAKLTQLSRSTTTATSSSSSSGLVAFIVMAREAKSEGGGSRQTFDPRAVRRAESTVGTSGASASVDTTAANRSGSREASSDAATVTQTSKTETGGSRTLKNDIVITNTITYGVYPDVGTMTSAVGSAFTTNSIKTTPWPFLVARCKVPSSATFSKTFAESPDGMLSDEFTGGIMVKLLECKEVNVSKLIFATVSIDGFRPNPNNGATMATGQVNILGMDLESGSVIANIGQAFIGQGSTQQDAARDAIRNAGQIASVEAVNQVRKK